MKTVILLIQFLITVALIGGSILQAAKSEGLGALGGSSEVYRGNSAKGFQAIVDKWMVYIAYAFLGVSLLCYIVVF
ncbi:MAG TPA: preprotein translocase subunit SecG [bacterium]|nr:preprotein translocase subunit SecG [bacterium]